MQVKQMMFIRAEEVADYNVETGEWEKKMYYSPHRTDMTGMAGWHMVQGEVEVTFEVPDTFDYHNAVLGDLQEQKKNAQAAFQKRMTELDAEISRYLALNAPKTSNGMDILEA